MLLDNFAIYASVAHQIYEEVFERLDDITSCVPTDIPDAVYSYKEQLKEKLENSLI